MDDELERIKELCDTKRKRLGVLDRQIALFGEKWAPPHLLTDRAELRESIAKYETVLGSALPTEVGDDLGAGGRFVLTLEEFKSVKDSVALYGYQLGELAVEMREFMTSTIAYRTSHASEHQRDRRWTIAAALALLIVAAFVLGRLV